MKSGRFDNNNLPVRWNAHVEDSAPYTVDPVFFRRIDEIVYWALERGLSIIIDFHHYEEMMSDPRGNKERFLAIWKQSREQQT
jgi:endoglucanase